MWGLKLWQEILIWVVIFIDLYIYVKLSQIKINGINLIKLRYRLLIAVLFPLVFVLAFMFAGVILALALVVLFILFLLGFFRKKRFKIRIF